MPDSDSLNDNVVSIGKKLVNFRQLLSDIESLDDKKRLLWLEIYENAITDRQNAMQNYLVLVEICQKKSSEHAVHGKTMASFLERMSKANDQLIRLAELVAKAKSSEENVSAEDLFNQIKGKN
jgi:hypothetical protein